jgi:hypothetical protein
MRTILLAGCAAFCISFSFACDICGAVNSSLGLGTIAMGNRHSIGLNYQLREYKSTHPRLFTEPETTSYETFQRFDVTGNIRLSGRFQAKVVVPVAVNQQRKEGVTSRKSGFGDPTASINYFLFDRADSLMTRQFRWTVGAGAKLPLGQYPEPHDPVLLLYPGTGTTDPFVQSTIMLRRNKWGIIQECNALFRTTNRHGYTPGNLFNATLFGFRRLGDVSVFAGLQYAWNGIDYVDRDPINSSPARGNLLTAAVGATYTAGNFQFQANYHIPLVQQLGNGYVKQLTSVSAGIFYLFN